jgi:hypothetical protein
MFKTAMKRLPVPLLAATVLAAALGVALAANPHFIFVKAALNNEKQLVVSFKEAGLGQNVLIHYLVTADATATYQCVNHGGKCPQAANKVDVAGPVSGTGAFSSGKNGQITGSITVDPPAPGEDLNCGAGQTEVVAAVSFSNIAISDTDTPVGPVAADPDMVSASKNVCP